MAVELVFGSPRYTGGAIELVFGGTDAPISLPSDVTVTAAFSAPVFQSIINYDNRNPRRAHITQTSTHQVADRRPGDFTSLWGNSDRRLDNRDSAWSTARLTPHEPDIPWGLSGRVAGDKAVPWQEGQKVSGGATGRHRAADRLARTAEGPWQEAQRLSALSAALFGRGTQRTANAQAPWGQARLYAVLSVTRAGVAPHAGLYLVGPWGVARVPPSGLEKWPPDDGNVTPPRVVDTNLVFACPPYEQGAPINLVFGHVCGDDTGGETIVVPVREVYVTINNYSLVRVDNSYLVPATQMTLGLDVDSWTWNVSFAVRGDVLPQIERDEAGNPVILQTSINGTAIRFAIEKISRDRTFGSSQLRVQGRGIASELDAPFAPVMSFGNTAARTAQQLLGDILTLNGESIGWGFGTLGFTDWLVPAGVFSHSGTYISALNAVASSVGAYVQPHNTLKQLDVLLRYPTPAWEWAGATPDIVLPSAVTTQEGIEWLDKPGYNRVYVSGQEGGILGRYTRTGTAGDVLAPQVVDPLITQAAAARQRGRAIISDTGRIANVTLRLPVLAETGIIKPGRMIQYTDGPTTRIGMSRSVSIDVALPTIYQTIMVETHVD